MIRALPLLLTLLTASAGPDPSWRHHESPVTDDLHNVFFLDEYQGWIVAQQSGTVLHTTDGGSSWWVQARLEEGLLESVYFRDERNGWICGDKGRLYRTTDGGSTWQLRKLDEELILYSVSFPEPKRGRLVAIDPRTRRPVHHETEDGGATWIRSEGIFPAQDLAKTIPFSPAILRSQDGGQTWKRSREMGVRTLDLSLERRAEGVRWLIGYYGTVLRTQDGATWERPSRFTRNRLWSLFFLDPRKGWAAGDADKEPGVLFETENGGDTWKRVEIDAPGLHRFAESPGRLWLVGKGGTILSRPRRAEEEKGWPEPPLSQPTLSRLP